MMLRAVKPWQEPDGTKHFFRTKPVKVDAPFHVLLKSEKCALWKIVYHVQRDRPLGERSYSSIEFKGSALQFQRDLVIARTFL